MRSKLHRCTARKSKLMREYFNAHYEDPAYIIIRRNPELKKLLDEKSLLEEGFSIALKHANPILYDRFDEIIGMYLLSEVLMMEEAYVLGVQDRDKSMQLQE